MPLLRLLLAIQFWTLAQIGIIVLSLLSLPLIIFPKNEALIHKVFAGVLRFLFFVCFVKVRIIDVEKLPKIGKMVFIANHPGLIDSFYLLAFLPVRFRFLLSGKFLQVPMLGYFLRKIGCVGYDPARQAGLAKTVLAVMEGPDPLLIFPERAELVKSKGLRFNAGAFSIAKVCGAAVVPLIIKGSDKVMAKDTVLLTPGRITIQISDPILPAAIAEAKSAARELEKRYAV